MFSRVPATAVLTGAAGLIHMAAAVTHVGESVLLGLLFALTGWAQMITAVWLSATRSRAAVGAMTATNIAALAGWAASRTVGLPLLHPGVEPVGTADALTVALEVLAVAAAAVFALRSDQPARRPRPLGLVTAGLVALATSGYAVVALGSGDGHGHAEEVAAAGEAAGHGHEEGESTDDHASSEKSSVAGSRQQGTLPAALHRHRPGIYHLHEEIDLHRHSGGIFHVHTKAGSEQSPSADQDSTGDGDHHDDGTDGHAH